MNNIKLTDDEKDLLSDDFTDEKPPILGEWKNLYSLVAAILIILIILFYIFTKAFE